jgi:hypothetical protein
VAIGALASLAVILYERGRVASSSVAG